MSATVQEIMNGNHLWNDGMTKGNTICPRPFHGGGIKKHFQIAECIPLKSTRMTILSPKIPLVLNAPFSWRLTTLEKLSWRPNTMLSSFP
jgi:hypothetical protein